MGEHDLPMSPAEVEAELGAEVAAEVSRLTRAILARGNEIAAERGILIADTKVEFGVSPDGSGGLVLADEVLTPGLVALLAGRAWEPGHPQPSYDKQFVRDWLTSAESGWDRKAGGPPPRAARARRRADAGEVRRGLRAAHRRDLLTGVAGTPPTIGPGPDCVAPGALRFRGSLQHVVVLSAESSLARRSAGVSQPSVLRGRLVEFGGDDGRCFACGRTGRCPWGSTGAAGRWCSRWCRAARASAGRRSRSAGRSGDRELGVPGHLGALVPGQGPPQLRRQGRRWPLPSRRGRRRVVRRRAGAAAWRTGWCVRRGCRWRTGRPCR